LLRISILVLVLLLGGCAYYNTFYNARSSYEEALDYAREHPDDPSQYEEDLLEKAVAGAGKVLARYPGSRWADDAQLLLGNALLLRGQRSLTGSGTSYFQEAMLSFASAAVITDDPSFVDMAKLGLGRAAMELGRYNDAVAALEDVSSHDNGRFMLSRLLLCEAYIESGNSELASAVFDTLMPVGGDSLRAEYYITGGEIFSALGMPDSGAVMCLQATAIEDRGDVYYRALVKAAEFFIEAGLPEKASVQLDRLLLGYRSDREMSDIFLLKGRADELAGMTDGALTAYLDAAELDSNRETGAEALFRRAALLERENRYDDALGALEDCAARPGDFMWLRLAEDRRRNLNLYTAYSDSVRTTSGEQRTHYRLLAAEKRLDLYGMDQQALDAFRQVVDSDHILFAPMAMVSLAENGGVSADSVDIVLASVLEMIPESDLAGVVEERLGLPPGIQADSRPSAVLERAWSRIDSGDWENAWSILNGLLESPFSYEVRAEALWAAYVASESARMNDEVVSGYLKELTDIYPDTPQGREAALRRAVGLESEDSGGEEE